MRGSVGTALRTTRHFWVDEAHEPTRGAELPTRTAAETPRGSPPRTRGSGEATLRAAHSYPGGSPPAGGLVGSVSFRTSRAVSSLASRSTSGRRRRL